MSLFPHEAEVLESVQVPGRGRLILLNPERHVRNIMLLDSDHSVIWCVRSDGVQDSPFTQMELKGSSLQAYCWDGFLYKIEWDTGFASPVELAR